MRTRPPARASEASAPALEDDKLPNTAPISLSRKQSVLTRKEQDSHLLRADFPGRRK